MGVFQTPAWSIVYIAALIHVQLLIKIKVFRPPPIIATPVAHLIIVPKSKVFFFFFFV